MGTVVLCIELESKELLPVLNEAFMSCCADEDDSFKCWSVNQMVQNLYLIAYHS